LTGQDAAAALEAALEFWDKIAQQSPPTRAGAAISAARAYARRKAS
jgi:hypothetical protein